MKNTTEKPIAQAQPTAQPLRTAQKTEQVKPTQNSSPKVRTNPNAANRVSALSLSGIRKKRELEQAKKQQVTDPDDLPSESFTESSLQKHWEDYVALIDKEGRKILGSALGSTTPYKKDDHIILIELANDTLKKEVESDQFPLMEYLKKSMNNYQLELEITVNESITQKYHFTAEEKYAKLQELNPLIDQLRKEFDLDL